MFSLSDDSLDYRTSFLFSSMDPPKEDQYFWGYAFVGDDYVVGDEGARLYRSATGKRVGGGRDGCYVTVYEEQGAWHFETDYGGFEILFYYNDGDFWIVSNSFIRTVEYLREHRRVEPHYSALASTGPGLAFKQFASFSTAAAGVMVAPLHHALVAEPGGGIHLVRTASEESSTERLATYEGCLEQHIEKWVSRFYTLLVDPNLDLYMDLTGGRDSRTNFSLLLATREFAERVESPLEEPIIRCGRIAGDKSDMRAASRICDLYGLRLHDMTPVAGRRWNGSVRYRSWKEMSLGVYGPVYFPVGPRNYFAVEVGGGGAANHRRTLEDQFDTSDPNEFINASKQDLTNSTFREAFAREQRALFDQFREWGVHEDDLLTEWYLQFRGRVHTGRPARYRTHFQPFISVELDRARRLASIERLGFGQINFDIIHAAQARLLELPYDDEAKRPSAAALGNLANLRVGEPRTEGRVWAGRGPMIGDEEQSVGEKPALSHLDDAFREALANPFVVDFFPKEYRDKAIRIMDSAVSRGKFRHAIGGAWITPIVLAHEVAPNR